MKAFLRDIVITLILTMIIFVVVQNTIQVSIVSGSSMEPDLHNGERILVNKVGYSFHQPERGDVVIFHPPRNSESTPFIKRIIGLPGDTVEIKGGKVYINGSPLDEPYIEDPPNYTLSQRKIQPDNYFVLGDNRNNTSDSHIWGTVPRENIIGEALLSLWPPQQWGLAPNHSYD